MEKHFINIREIEDCENRRIINLFLNNHFNLEQRRIYCEAYADCLLYSDKKNKEIEKLKFS